MKYERELKSLKELENALYIPRRNFHDTAVNAIEDGRVLERAYQSPVYKLLWGERGIDNNLETLLNLPTLTGDFYTTHFKERDKSILVSPVKPGQDAWLASSGTQRRKYLPFSEYDAKRLGLYSTRAFTIPGVKSTDTVISFCADLPHVSGALNKWIADILGHSYIEVSKSKDPKKIMEEILRNSANIKCIAGVTLIAIKLLQTISEKLGKKIDEVCPNLDTAVVGGEVLTKPKRAVFKKLANITAYNTYASLELGGTAVECNRHDGMHIFCDDNIYMLKSGSKFKFIWECEPGDRGSLIVTTPDREAFPLVNYDMKDIVEIVGTQCPCGITHPKIKILGRADDAMNIDGAKVYPIHFEELFDSVKDSGTIQERQIHWYKDREYGYSTLEFLITGDFYRNKVKGELIQKLFEHENLSQLASNYEIGVTKIKIVPLTKGEFDRSVVKKGYKTILVVKKFKK